MKTSPLPPSLKSSVALTLADRTRRAGVRLCRAFSLVELTMAIGIASFGMITVMGLLPLGLKVMREAVDQTEESQIVQQLHGEIAQTPFSRLSARYSNATLYFGEGGESLTTSTSARYVVRTSLAAPVYPGSGNAPGGSVSSHILTVQIDIARVQGGGPASRYNVQVPRSGD